MLILVFLLSILPVASPEAALISVNPVSAPADTPTGFTFTTEASAAGVSVELSIYNDFNNNSIIDSDEWPIINGPITDNGSNTFNELLTWDGDPAPASITAVLNPFSGYGGFLPPGNFIVRVLDSMNASATARFSVAPASGPMTVSGTVYKAGTLTPVANAAVACISAAGGGSAITDGNGLFTLQIPSAGEYYIETRKQGHLSDTGSITVPASGIGSYIIYLIPQLTGTVTEQGSTSAVAGAEIWARSTDGRYSQALTDANGSYALPLPGGVEWFLGVNEPDGYFGSLIPLHNYSSGAFITPETSPGSADNGQYALDFSEAPPDTGHDEEVGYVGLGQSLPNLADTEFTIEAWVKRNSANSLNGGIFSRAVDHRGILMYVNNSIPKFAMKKDGLATYNIDSRFTLQNGIWTHIAATLVNEDHSAVHAACNTYDVGINSSIAVDASGNLHISHYDADHGDLLYTTNSSGSWITETASSAGNVGQFTSIALDSLGKVHISYHDATDLSLMYATNASGSWAAEIVDDGGVGGNVGKYTSIVLDSSGKVYISYFRQKDTTSGTAYSDLMFASNASGSFQHTVVDSANTAGRYTSIKLDSSGNPHISYLRTYNGGLSEDLKYATRRGVTPGGGSCAGTGGSSDWACTFIDTGLVGRFSSLATDSADKIHISYYDAANKRLKYATNASGSWVNTVVDSTGDAGTHTSLITDAANKPHITYFDAAGQTLKYATNASGSWQTETVDSSPGAWVTTPINPTTSDIETGGASIAIDGAGDIHISFLKQRTGDLMHSSGQAGSWNTEAVLVGSDAGESEMPHVDMYVNGTYQNCGSTAGNFSDALDLGNSGNPVNEVIGESQIVSVDTGTGNDWKNIQDPNYISPRSRLLAVIDEVRFWKVARTVSDVAQCMNSELLPGSGACGIDNSILKGYWRFNEGTGATVIDNSGSGNNGAKVYCDLDCENFTATNFSWNNGWTDGNPFQASSDTSIPVINFTVHQETAWIQGTVKDETGINAVENALIYARRINTASPPLRSLHNAGFTDSLGSASIGLEPGDWEIGTCMRCHNKPVMIGGVQKDIVPASTVSVTLVPGETKQVSLSTYYADGAIEGVAYLANGTTLAPAGTVILASTDNAFNGAGQSSVGSVQAKTEVNANGEFRLPLLSGTWILQADWMGKYQSPKSVVTLTTDGDEVIEAGEMITGHILSLNGTFAVNTAPFADAGGPYAGTEGSSLTLNGSSSSDPNNNISTYEWDIDNNGTYDYSSASSSQSHTYAQQGTYTIKLRVTDAMAATSEATTTAVISDTSPTAGFTGNTTNGRAPLTVSFTNSSTGYDTPLTYEWDFDNNGTVDSTLSNPSYDYTNAGTYAVKLTVTDSDSSANSLTRLSYISATSCYSPVKITGAVNSYHTYIQSAYIDSSQGDDIRFQNVSFSENLIFNSSKAITLRGGYDCDFNPTTNKTVINGNVTISDGVVTMENVIIQ
ncbi:MAG: PKD domain-containing protein [Thermodesulfovibrionia bacterium]|nr:PKD domain-containing protein [Thermodesulfovibrionia bacterium]